MLLSKCAVCNGKNSKFLKQQKASGLLSSLEIKIPWNKILLLVLFCFKSIQQVNTRFKRKEIVNKPLLPEDKFIPETHLGEPRFIYGTCAPFTKNKEQIKKWKKQEIQDIFI